MLVFLISAAVGSYVASKLIIDKKYREALNRALIRDSLLKKERLW